MFYTFLLQLFQYAKYSNRQVIRDEKSAVRAICTEEFDTYTSENVTLFLGTVIVIPVMVIFFTIFLLYRNKDDIERELCKKTRRNTLAGIALTGLTLMIFIVVMDCCAVGYALNSHEYIDLPIANTFNLRVVIGTLVLDIFIFVWFSATFMCYLIGYCWNYRRTTINVESDTEVNIESNGTNNRGTIKKAKVTSDTDMNIKSDKYIELTSATDTSIKIKSNTDNNKSNTDINIEHASINGKKVADFNITSTKDINIAGTDINIKSTTGIKTKSDTGNIKSKSININSDRILIKSATGINITSDTDIKVKIDDVNSECICENDIDIQVKTVKIISHTGIKITSDTDIDIKSATNIKIKCVPEGRSRCPSKCKNCFFIEFIVPMCMCIPFFWLTLGYTKLTNLWNSDTINDYEKKEIKKKSGLLLVCYMALCSVFHLTLDIFWWHG